MGFELVRHTFEYQAIKELHEAKGYAIKAMCELLKVTRSAYYHWLASHKMPQTIINERLADLIRYIYEADDDKGYRRIRDDLVNDFDLKVNDKRVLRICRKLHIQSKIKHPANSITRAAKNPYHTAKSYLNRTFVRRNPIKNG